MFWVYIGVYTGLVLFGGLMSGLTIGLLSLDQTTLFTLKDAGTPTEKKHAKRILPVVKRHHLLLVTLLLANAVAVEAMPIFLAKVSNPIIAIAISVTAVLIFGELVYCLMGMFFIISYPLSKLLDCMLGHERGTLYRRGQLKALIDMHGEERGDGRGEESLSKAEVSIIKSALDMKNKTAKDAMVAIDQVYMLSLNAHLDSDTMSEISEKGHSRIPVYESDRSNITALVLTKRLIEVDPEDAIAVSEVVSNKHYARKPLFVDSDMPLFDLLDVFQIGQSHLALIRKAKQSEQLAASKSVTESTPLIINTIDKDYVDAKKEGDIIGIITLVDVVEELLQEKIGDELDVSLEMSIKLSMYRLHTSISRETREREERGRGERDCKRERGEKVQ